MIKKLFSSLFLLSISISIWTWRYELYTLYLQKNYDLTERLLGLTNHLDLLLSANEKELVEKSNGTFICVIDYEKQNIILTHNTSETYCSFNLPYQEGFNVIQESETEYVTLGKNKKALVFSPRGSLKQDPLEYSGIEALFKKFSIPYDFFVVKNNKIIYPTSQNFKNTILQINSSKYTYQSNLSGYFYHHTYLNNEILYRLPAPSNNQIAIFITTLLLFLSLFLINFILLIKKIRQDKFLTPPELPHSSDNVIKNNFTRPNNPIISEGTKLIEQIATTELAKEHEEPVPAAVTIKTTKAEFSKVFQRNSPLPLHKIFYSKETVESILDFRIKMKQFSRPPLIKKIDKGLPIFHLTNAPESTNSKIGLHLFHYESFQVWAKKMKDRKKSLDYYEKKDPDLLLSKRIKGIE